MKLPRDVSADQLRKALGRLGYQLDRQSGSHLTLVHESRSDWQVGFPSHNPLKVGMLGRVIAVVARQQGVSPEELLRKLKL